MLQFGVGAYSIENDHGVQLHSSRAVSGPFGTALESFSLNCEVKYVVEPVNADENKNERSEGLTLIEVVNNLDSAHAQLSAESSSPLPLKDDINRGTEGESSVAVYARENFPPAISVGLLALLNIHAMI